MKQTTYIFCLLLLTIFSKVDGYSVFEHNGKVGLKNEAGKVLIPAKYEALGWSQGEFSILSNVTGYRTAGKWGLISLSNNILTKPEFEEISPLDASLLMVRKKSSTLKIVTGIMNTSGKEVIPFQYDDIQLASLRAIVYSRIGNQYKCGLVDLDNRILIPQQFKKIRSIGSLRYAAENFENKWALFSDSGKQITQFTIDSISSFYKNYAIIYQEKNQGLIDRDGVIKIQPIHREVKIDSEGSVHFRQSSTILFLDGQNTLYQKISADSITGIGKNLLKVSNAGLIQLNDLNLQPISTQKINTLENFVNGNAIFSFDNKFGVIKSDGTIVIEPKYTELKRDNKFFLSNIKQGSKNNWKVLDSIGKPLHTKSYDAILPLTGQIFPVINKSFWGALDMGGREILACTYDSILQSKNENIVVKFHGQYGIVNQREHWLVPPRPNKVHLVFDDRFIEYAPKTAYLKSFDNGIIYFSENKLETQENILREHLPSGTIWEIGTNGVILKRIVMPEGVEE
ncbi:MAG TPA: WG repeat-containing protein, partial [Chryseolinea sp.]|nr:WG repeat-containing protein [Chryseolinea sp.]